MNLPRNVAKRSGDKTTIEEETFPAAEKILSDIENVMKKDSELASFEIIPIQDNENKSPVYHEEHSLGLASWCVQPLYCYAYGRLLDLRRSEYRREQPSTISRWLMGALLLNPDVGTFWNMKRELVKAGRLDALGELRFTAIVLHYKAKCFEAFAYRRWLLRQLLIGGESSDRLVENLLSNEINVAGISADRYANNYHAWSHREHVVSSWEKTLPESYGNLLKSEWTSSGKWCSRHVSDHSGLAFRQFLLKRLLREKRTIAPHQLAERRESIGSFVASFPPISEKHSSMLKSEDSWELLSALHSTELPRRPDVDYDSLLAALSYWAEDCKHNENDILSYPGHEALWYHRRFLGHTLARLENSYRRHCLYDFEAIESHIRGPDPAGIGCAKDGSGNEETGGTGFLSLVFHRDNERIVVISQNSKNKSQIKLGEKFVKYMRDFSSHGTNDEER